MAETTSNRKFDSLDFFLGVMTLLTVVAVFFFFHSWTKLGQLKSAVAKADDTLEQIRQAASRRPPEGPTREGLPTQAYFGQDVPAQLGGKARPKNVQLRAPSPKGEDWDLHSWVANWDSVDRRDLANYIREAESDWPGVRAAALEMREPENEDPQRNQWRASVTFTFYAPQAPEAE